MVPFSVSDVRRVLVTVHDHDVSPRFDMTLEVLIVEKSDNGLILDQKNLLLSEPSAEELCSIVQSERVQDVICGGIEEEFFQYLTWKKIRVFDNVIGPADVAVEAWRLDELKEDTIFRQ
ncbi:NifB/NifX family molybdenum-iron cluster-binding protein [Desulfonatronovibrio magnus]|uniref:NifB/NifX family molybdenum-iron cluster-binding protein n=1 Tax=Desulfonatronovibrio magnus TaxID=698827 RepID=UPI0005EB35E9|nr:hypothetical protein [Desulfonatronovibrio magnus]RQD60267.1 MAG: dinitrogenase iron-molybdenum cofactor biosynthesis protein [Desulfonatronovibrio sp. MSAO_Bac4]